MMSGFREESEASELTYMLQSSTSGNNTDKSNNNDDNAEDENSATTRYTYLVGVLSAATTTIAQVAGIACVQLMNQIPPDFQLNALRFGVGILFSVAYLSIKTTVPKVSRENIKWLLAVAMTTICYNLTLYSHNLKRIPIVTLLCIHQTFRIILTLILSKIFLKSEIPLVKCIICFVTIVGAVFTVVPRVEVYLDWKTEDSTYENLELNKTFPDVERFFWNTFPNGSEQSKYSELRNYSNQNIEDDLIIKDLNETFHEGQMREGQGQGHDDHDIQSFLLAVCVIFLASLSSTIETILISGSPLKHENTVIFSFWYFVIGAVFSTTVSLMFEHPIIPDNFTDIMLCFGHSIAVCSVTYLDLVAVQILDVNVYVIIISMRLPLAFLIQLTVLKGVIPVKHLEFLITGTIMILITNVAMPTYEYWNLSEQK